jgi:hypothetical protein
MAPSILHWSRYVARNPCSSEPRSPPTPRRPAHRERAHRGAASRSVRRSSALRRGSPALFRGCFSRPVSRSARQSSAVRRRRGESGRARQQGPHGAQPPPPRVTLALRGSRRARAAHQLAGDGTHCSWCAELAPLPLGGGVLPGRARCERSSACRHPRAWPGDLGDMTSPSRSRRHHRTHVHLHRAVRRPLPDPREADIAKQRPVTTKIEGTRRGEPRGIKDCRNSLRSVRSVGPGSRVRNSRGAELERRKNRSRAECTRPCARRGTLARC